MPSTIQSRDPARPRSRRRRRPRARRFRNQLAAAALVLLIAGVLTFFFASEVEWAEIKRALAALPVVPLLLLMVLLPPLGLSISVVYLVAGARFGPVVGGAVVAGVTAAHLLLMHGIARGVMRGPIERLLARRHHHLPSVPEGENASLATVAALAPGLPYFSRNYLLALAGVPLRIYFWICLPLYVLRSYVTIFLGDLTQSPDRGKLTLLVAVWVLKLAVCGWLVWRFHRRHRAGRSSPHPGNIGSAVS